MGCHCASYCGGGCRTYTSGYKDGYAQARAEEDILKGEDPTMYLFVGGPYHNEYKKTGGKPYVTAMIAPQLSAMMYCPHTANCGIGLPRYCGHSCCVEPTIRTGTYEKTKTSTGFFVYRWKP